MNDLLKTVFEIFLICVLLLLAALTAASETSIVAASRLKLKRLAAGGLKTARTVLKILETPEKFFGTILVANNIVDALIASIITAIMIRVMGVESSGVIAATAIVTFLIIVSEVAAKTLAAKNSEKLSLSLAGPVSMLIRVFSPIVRVLAVITNFIVRVIGGETKGKPALITEEEIRALIKMGEEEGSLHKEKYRMLSNVFEFSEAIVKNVMTPKNSIVSVDMSSDFNDILNRVIESGYSRFPVYINTPDNIIGILNMKDLLGLTCNPSLVVLQDIVYPAQFVPESKKVTELLKDFQKGHTHLAIVQDAQGAVTGLVTLEDLLEEIVGEIKDEYDIRI